LPGTMRHQVGTFLRLVWGEWSSLVTGSLSAVLVLIGLGISIAGAVGAKIPADSIIQFGTWVLAAVCGGQAAYSVWAREHSRAVELDEKISSKLKLSFDEDIPGCVRRTMLRLKPFGSGATSSTSSVSVPTVSFSGYETSTTGSGLSQQVPGIHCTYYRIKVDNDSASPVNACRGRLVSVKLWDNDKYISIFDGDTLDLTFAPAERPDTIAKTVNQGISEYLDFIIITDDCKVIIPTYKWESYVSAHADTMFERYGYYLLRIAIVYAGSTVFENILFLWNGNRQTLELRSIDLTGPTPSPSPLPALAGRVGISA